MFDSFTTSTTETFDVIPTSNFMDIGDITLEYQLSGNAHTQTILFIHGLGANQSQYEYQHIFFRNSYRVLSVSLRGHGKSSFPKHCTIKNFRLQKLALDLIKLLDSLEIDKVHYVGNSMGGNIGYEFLASYPERLHSICTFGTTAYLKKSMLFVGFIKLMYRIIGTKTISHLSYTSGNTTYAKYKIMEMLLLTSKTTILNLIPHLKKINYLKVIKSSSTPTLIIKGSKDEEINTVLASTIACFKKRGNFELKELKNAGHFTNLDNPEGFNKTLLSFLKTHDPTRY